MSVCFYLKYKFEKKKIIKCSRHDFKSFSMRYELNVSYYSMIP